MPDYSGLRAIVPWFAPPPCWQETGDGCNSPGSLWRWRECSPPYPLLFCGRFHAGGGARMGVGVNAGVRGPSALKNIFLGVVASRGFPLGVPADIAALAPACSGALHMRARACGDDMNGWIYYVYPRSYLLTNLSPFIPLS